MTGSAYRESCGGLYITIKTMSSFVLCSFYRVSFMSLSIFSTAELIFLAPAVTVGETEGALDSASVLVFTSSFAYNFVRK